MKEQWIWLDMDGTFVDLYGVKGWCDDLQALNPRPYEVAKNLYDLVEFVLVLNDLKQKGYKLGIISWCAKAKNPIFDEQIKKAKVDWLVKNCIYDFIDKVLITQYGINKAESCKPFGSGILVDDEERNRNDWTLGNTINASNRNLIEDLRALL